MATLTISRGIASGSADTTGLQASGFDAERLAPVYQLLEREVVGAETPAGLLALARLEGPVSLHVAGRARWDPADEPATADKLFAIASISKPIVAVAVMQLFERGAFLLDDPVARHIPEFGQNGKQGVTVRHLLSHTSGLDEHWMRRQVEAEPHLVDSWDSQVATICRAPVTFKPGTLVSYCNPPFTILGELVRRLSGQTIDSYLAESVLGPANMTDTTFFPTGPAEARVAQVALSGWPEDQTARNRAFGRMMQIPMPAGGLFSTAHDLIAFGRACLAALWGQPYQGTRLLTPATMRAMLQPQTAGLNELVSGQERSNRPPRALGYALVGLPQHDYYSPSAFGHGGATGTQLLIDPEQNLIAVFLANRLGWDGRGRQRVMYAAVAASSVPQS